ncbi:MAG: PspC domain-containing protein [Methanolobus sp.]|uniref:PspC domain-containing protein n=1 Tax=Methanolobus sp. TaxID=1874737 RepID=UPI002730F556|nr:PspC domain-containing protein [Methanolobus sp.]MDP2216173.1 PspC domain-containing protein [Methanolobus sp.]
MVKLLRRPKHDRMIAGVCSGVGEYLGVDPVVIRLIVAAATLMGFGSGLLVYLIAWVIIPEEG